MTVATATTPRGNEPSRPGEKLQVSPSLAINVMVTSAETCGSLLVAEAEVSPGELLMPHVHQFEDQWTLVTAGVLEVLVGDKVYELGAGQSVLRPRGLVHTLWNRHAKPARHIEVTTPAALEGMFRQLSADHSRSGGEIAELAATFGVSYRPDLVADISQRYGVQLAVTGR